MQTYSSGFYFNAAGVELSAKKTHFVAMEAGSSISFCLFSSVLYSVSIEMQELHSDIFSLILMSFLIYKDDS